MIFTVWYDDKVNGWWQVDRETGLSIEHIADFSSREEAIAYCCRDETYVEFGSHDKETHVGSLRDLFTNGQYGFQAASGVIEGFNALCCLAARTPDMSVAQALELAKLHPDIVRLAEFFSLPVNPKTGDAFSDKVATAEKRISDIAADRDI